jgi:Leucine Rich repeat
VNNQIDKRNHWPLIVFLLGVAACNLVLPSLPFGRLSQFGFIQSIINLLTGIVFGQMLFALLLGGLFERFWLRGVVFGSLLAALWMGSVVLGLFFAAGWFIGPIEPSVLWFVFVVPLLVFGGSLPLFFCGYAFGWRLTRRPTEFFSSRNFGIEELFYTTAAIASFLFLCRVPQIAMELTPATVLVPVGAWMGTLAAVCLLVVVPLLYASFRVQDRPRRWFCYIGVVGGYWLIPIGLAWAFGLPDATLFVTTLVFPTAIILILGMSSLRMSGYVLTGNANRRDSVVAEVDIGVVASERKHRRRWAAGLLVFSALASGSLIAIDAERTRIDIANVALQSKMREQGSSIDLLGRTVIELNFGPETNNQMLEDFEGLTDVQTISLAHTKVTDSGLRFLSKFPRLNRLDLSHTEVTDDGLVELQRLRKLAVLNLGYTKVTLPRLAIAKSLTDASLDLSGLGITDEELPLLWSDSNQSNRSDLKLSLRDNKLTDSGLKAFFKYHWGDFDAIDLSGNPIDGSCLTELRSVRDLILEGLPLTDASLASFISPSGPFRGPIDKIGLAGNQLTAASLAGFSNEIELGEGNLTDAELRKCTVTSLRALKFKGKSFDGSCFDTWHPTINQLDLEDTGVNDETVKFLANVNSLYRLNLAGTEITDAALPYLKNAHQLNLSSTRITFQGLRDSQLQSMIGIQVSVGQFSVDEIRELKKKLPIVVGKMNSLLGF